MEEKALILEYMDGPFVLAYQIDVEVQTVQFVVITKRLLANVSHVQNLHVDATYKCLLQGYSVLMVGTPDKDNKFFCPAEASCLCIDVDCDRRHIWTPQHSIGYRCTSRTSLPLGMSIACMQ